MEGSHYYNTHDGEMTDLPPGFRFHPTDEELVTHYLSHKVLDCNFHTEAVGEVDLNKVEPWDLPWRAKIGEKEWYFFCVRDRKYPTGSRTNRATDAGYWKATGKDKEIFQAKILVGMKKTLVFYRGRAPKGAKTNWVMHEYRLEGKTSNSFPKMEKKEWVLCRVFKKCSGGKKVHISGLVKTEDPHLDLPPLIDVSPDEHTATKNAAEGSHVTCFSTLKQDPQNESIDKYISSDMKFLHANSIFSSQTNQRAENLHRPDSVSKQEHETGYHVSPPICKYEDGLEPYDDDRDFLIVSTEQIDLDCLWNF